MKALQTLCLAVSICVALGYGVQLPGCPPIITRAQWGAREPSGTTRLTRTPTYAIIHHGGAGSGCFKQASCSSKVRGYQNYHMDTRGWTDIGYNFLVGEDGKVYEGRGWDNVGVHAYGYNSKSLGICVIGNFITAVPKYIARNAVKKLLSCALRNKKLAKSYVIKGHRDVSSTECPGQKFYNVIKTWKRYKD